MPGRPSTEGPWEAFSFPLSRACPLARRGQYGRLRRGGPKTLNRGFWGNQCFSGASWSSHRFWPPSSPPSPASGATAATTAVSSTVPTPEPPLFPSSTYLTLRTYLRGRNICFKSGACCLCAAACDLSQCGDACCCVTQGRIVSEKQRFLWPMPLQDSSL